MTPEEKEEQRRKTPWRPLYAWRAVPVIVQGEKDGKPVQRQLPFPQYSVKQWSHSEGALLIGAPKRTSDTGQTYIVFPDHTLRCITRRAYDLLASLPAPLRVKALLNPPASA